MTDIQNIADTMDDDPDEFGIGKIYDEIGGIYTIVRMPSSPWNPYYTIVDEAGIEWKVNSYNVGAAHDGRLVINVDYLQ